MKIQEIEKIIRTLKKWNDDKDIIYLDNSYFVMFDIENDLYTYSLFFEDVFKRDFSYFVKLIEYKNELIKANLYG